MKIDLSPKRITPDALVIWSKPTPEVDIVMDMKNLTFRPGSVEQIIAHHVIDHFIENDSIEALNNWKECLAPLGKLYVVSDDFEYIARAFTGGDIDISTFNKHHAHPSQWDRKSLGDTLLDLGFHDENMRIWFSDIQGVMRREHYELIIEAIK